MSVCGWVRSQSVGGELECVCVRSRQVAGGIRVCEESTSGRRMRVVGCACVCVCGVDEWESD